MHAGVPSGTTGEVGHHSHSCSHILPPRRLVLVYGKTPLKDPLL